MPIIEVNQLAKDFRRPKRFEGPFGGLRTLVTRQYETAQSHCVRALWWEGRPLGCKESRGTLWPAMTFIP